MKTINTKLNINTSYPLMDPFTWEDILFFDIETTGLSANTSYLYLIGCMYYRDNTWQATQWLADDMNSEVRILKAFFNTLKSYKRLVHFNGSGFDIPFVLQKCKQHNLEYTFDAIESFDIYRKILPCKKLLPLPNYKLKTVEKFVGINRKDCYTGEELIQIYANYLGRLQYERLLQKNSSVKSINSKTGINSKTSSNDIISYNERDNSKNLSSEELSQILLLHNLEDVNGLSQVADILFYMDIFKKDPLDTLSPKKELTMMFGEKMEKTVNSLTRLEFLLPHTLPQTVTLITPLPEITADNRKRFPEDKDVFSLKLKISGNQLTVILPVYEGELKYFYENYRDYFYLPKEDTAIHKSIAQFVDKEFKIKAKPTTCYNKKYGRFFPQVENMFTPYFKNNYNDKITYFEISNKMLQEPTTLYQYTKSILHYISCSKETRILY